MAVKRIIEIVVKGGEALKDVKKLFNERLSIEKEINEQQKENEKNTEKATEGLKKQEKATKSAKKTTKGLSTGFKALGTAIKATGIGLVVALIAKLSQAFVKNEKIGKAVSMVFETINVALSSVVNALVDAFDSASNATGGFDALGKVLNGLLTISLIPIKVAFFSIKGGILAAQLVWEKSFFGGNDKDKIKELQEGILSVNESLKEVAEDAVDAGKQIADNFGEAVSEVGDIGNAIVEETSKITAESIKNQAKLNIQLRNNAEIAAAQQTRLVEQYDRQAEKLRQIRDNDLKSIDERIKANDDLLKVLDMQEKSMLKQADLQIAAAQNELNQNKTTENRVALINALANKEGVLAQIEGFRSEQKTNANSLEKESIELNQSRIDGETERALKQKEFTAQQEQDTLARLELEKSVLEQEKLIEEERLQNKVDSFALGTQARIDAENELENRLQELRFASLENEKAINEEKDRIESKSIKQREDEAKALEQTKEVLITDGLKTVQSLLKKNSAASKGLAAAQTIFDTQQGITSALAAKSPSDQLLPFPVRLANAAIVGVKGALALRNILKTNPEKGGGSSPSTGGGGQAAPPAPAFNLIGQGGGINQIDQSLQQEQQPIQAFVVSGNVTSAQELDRNIVDTATIV